MSDWDHSNAKKVIEVVNANWEIFVYLDGEKVGFITEADAEQGYIVQKLTTSGGSSVYITRKGQVEITINGAPAVKVKEG